jgi:hypothetical protein
MNRIICRRTADRKNSNQNLLTFSRRSNFTPSDDAMFVFGIICCYALASGTTADNTLLRVTERTAPNTINTIKNPQVSNPGIIIWHLIL